MDGFIIITGLCLTFIPLVMYVNYLFKHIKEPTKFDKHIELIRDKKGKKGIAIAYLNRILLGTLISSFGLLMNSLFKNETLLIIVIISLVMYIITTYIDNNNEK